MEYTGVLAVIEQDLRLIRQVQDLCNDCGLKINITRGSEEAVCYLRGVGVYANRKQFPRPGLILLDTQNESGGDLTVLQWLRDEPAYHKIPIAFLTNKARDHSHLACAIDPECFFVDRESLWELPTLAFNVFFSQELHEQKVPPESLRRHLPSYNSAPGQRLFE